MSRSIIVSAFLFGWIVFQAPVDAQAQSSTRNRAGSSRESSPGVAVVELFTSQGCSSCPPADAVLRKVAAAAEKSDLPVYALSFHVDYWNRLGWNDPYSATLYSQRQRAYASLTGKNRVYTPQMIVGGVNEFLGSDSSKANLAIRKSLTTKPDTNINLKITTDSDEQKVQVQFTTDRTINSSVMNVALVQSSASNRVPKGENAGRELSHAHVVRGFKIAELAGSSGQVTIEVPADIELAKAKIVAYLQNKRSLVIHAAAAKPVFNNRNDI